MANKELILGLDVGSSSVKAALFDHRGQQIPKTIIKIERKLKATRDGGSEIDADAAFRQVVTVVDELLSRSKSPKGKITHVATCTFWHSLLGIDIGGNPTSPVLGWADNRSREHVAALRKRFDEGETHNRTGARFHSSFWPAKLLWFRNAHPAVWDRTTRWISVGDYLSLKLSGELSTSVSIASGTGVLNIRDCTWDEKIIRFLKLKRSQLPPVAEDSHTFRLNSKFVKRWPQLKDAMWFLPIADGAANSIGSGCSTKGKAALMVGTSGAMRVILDEPPAQIPGGLWCYRVDHERYILGGALSDGGGLIDWLKANLKLPNNAETLMAQRPSGAKGVTVLPFFAGERSTGYDESAQGAILGLTMANDSLDILRAAMEGIAGRFAAILRQIESVTPVREIVASGGALRNSPVFARIIADALGRELTLSDAPEASMRGAVLLALETIGKMKIADSDSQ